MNLFVDEERTVHEFLHSVATGEIPGNIEGIRALKKKTNI
jgi:hypothetical protein